MTGIDHDRSQKGPISGGPQPPKSTGHDGERPQMKHHRHGSDDNENDCHGFLSPCAAPANLGDEGGPTIGTVGTIAVFGSSDTAPGTHDWQEAEALGWSLATAGHAVATGGYAGTMEAASKGAHQAGGHVVGVTADLLFPHRGGPNRYVIEVRDHQTIASRIGDLVDSSDAAIVLPGSIGTAAELLVAWNRAAIDSFREVPKWPLIAVGQPWNTVIPGLLADLSAPDVVTLVPNANAAADQAIEFLT